MAGTLAAILEYEAPLRTEAGPKVGSTERGKERRLFVYVYGAVIPTLTG